MKKALCLLLAMVFLRSFLPSSAAAAGDTPVIALTFTPAYGEFEDFEGIVFREDGGSFNPAQYRISLYLQLYAGDLYWVKPSFAEPYADLNSDGSFSICYTTGGQDQNAEVLHIMLIPSTCTPTADFEETKANALDYVKITRKASGFVNITPSRQAPGEPENSCRRSGLAAGAHRIAVNIGFHTDSSRPGDRLSPDLMRRQLYYAAEFADTVRFYASAGEISQAYTLAYAMHLKVVGTAWLSGDDQSDQTELDALIEHCNNGLVQIACVGSETLLRDELTADDLIQDIEYVREHLTDDSIPVTTADNVDLLLAHPELLDACDILMPNCYPYWAGISIAKAGANFAAWMESLREAAAGKEIFVSETGWPSSGQTIGSARAGEQEAAWYFEEVRRWSLATGTPVLWFAAADEPWKITQEGEAGAYWGILTKDFVLKSSYAQTDFFRSIHEEIYGSDKDDFTHVNIRY
ncbi:MAG: hypothetical protein QM296_01180 [Bacillota bacterium]|nr:hypothetical protein [Bacillota bacterium]